MYSLLISGRIHFTYILSRICVSHLLCLLSSYFLSQFESDLLRARAPAGVIPLKSKQVGPAVSTRTPVTAEAAVATCCLHCGPCLLQGTCRHPHGGARVSYHRSLEGAAHLGRDKGKMQRSAGRMTSHAANNDQIVFRYGAHTGSYIRAEECGKRPSDS